MDRKVVGFLPSMQWMARRSNGEDSQIVCWVCFEDGEVDALVCLDGMPRYLSQMRQGEDIEVYHPTGTQARPTSMVS
jgi:hypothetical protein